jgi:fido (protein-threonine AMPylation protein)
MPVAYKWRPIADLGENPKSLTDGELESLKRVWANQKDEMVQLGTLDEFEKRLRREWAIETGIIEGVYTLTRGVTRTLIAKGIEAALIPHNATNRDPVLVARIIQDHYDVLETLFDFVGRQRQLSTGYVKELHAGLLRNIETYTVVDQFGQAFEKRLEKGCYKSDPNSPTRPDGLVHEFCPPEHVASEMDRLLQMHIEHETSGVSAEVEAAWLHHRFAQIHPFADGNGRVARAITSLVFIKAGWFPLVAKDDDKARYIESLENADAEDLRPLVAMFVEAQRNALIQASEVAYDVRPITSPHDAIVAVRDRLLQRGKLSQREWLQAKQTAGQMHQFALKRFGKVAQELQEEIGSLGKGLSFGSVNGVSNAAPNAKVVQDAGHAADFGEYQAAAQLSLSTGRRDAIVLSFHALGPRFHGIIGAVAYLLLQGAEPVPVKHGTFLINYEEDLATAQTRFSAWLERVIVEGLNEWRKTL